MKPLYDLLLVLIQWVDEIPPIEQPMRFGNKAFKTWLDRVTTHSTAQIKGLCNQPEFSFAVPELKAYWEESFGQYERLDYGTGHELNFIVFLFCMFKLGLYT